MPPRYEFAIAIGPYLSAAGYLNADGDPQQFVSPSDNSSYLPNDILLEPDCGAAEFSPAAGFIDLNVYVGDIDFHVHALRDLANRALRSLPIRDGLGFGTLISASDVSDFETIVKLIRKTKPDLAAVGEGSDKWILDNASAIARLLHLAVMFRAFRTIARRTTLKPCNSAILAVPPHLWGLAGAAATIAQIPTYFVVDPVIAAIAAQRHDQRERDRREGVQVGEKVLRVSEMPQGETLALEVKYCGVSVSYIAPELPRMVRRLGLSTVESRRSKHPDDVNDVPHLLQTLIETELGKAFSDAGEIAANTRRALLAIRDRLERAEDGGRSGERLAMFGSDWQGALNIAKVVQVATEHKVERITRLNELLREVRPTLETLAEIFVVGSLRYGSKDERTPASSAAVWLVENLEDLIPRPPPFRPGGSPSRGAAALCALDGDELGRFLPTDWRDAKPDQGVVQIVQAMMNVVGEVHFSEGIRSDN